MYKPDDEKICRPVNSSMRKKEHGVNRLRETLPRSHGSLYNPILFVRCPANNPDKGKNRYGPEHEAP